MGDSRRNWFTFAIFVIVGLAAYFAWAGPPKKIERQKIDHKITKTEKDQLLLNRARFLGNGSIIRENAFIIDAGQVAELAEQNKAGDVLVQLGAKDNHVETIIVSLLDENGQEMLDYSLEKSSPPPPPALQYNASSKTSGSEKF